MKREKEDDGASLNVSNIVIIILCQGLSPGLHQDYSLWPIITWETEGEAQCQTLDQQTQTLCDKHAATWATTGQHMVKIMLS